MDILSSNSQRFSIENKEKNIVSGKPLVLRVHFFIQDTIQKSDLDSSLAIIRLLILSQEVRCCSGEGAVSKISSICWTSSLSISATGFSSSDSNSSPNSSFLIGSSPSQLVFPRQPRSPYSLMPHNFSKICGQVSSIVLHPFSSRVEGKIPNDERRDAYELNPGSHWLWYQAPAHARCWGQQTNPIHPHAQTYQPLFDWWICTPEGTMKGGIAMNVNRLAAKRALDLQRSAGIFDHPQHD